MFSESLKVFLQFRYQQPVCKGDSCNAYNKMGCGFYRVWGSVPMIKVFKYSRKYLLLPSEICSIFAVRSGGTLERSLETKSGLKCHSHQLGIGRRIRPSCTRLGF